MLRAPEPGTCKQLGYCVVLNSSVNCYSAFLSAVLRELIPASYSKLKGIIMSYLFVKRNRYLFLLLTAVLFFTDSVLVYSQTFKGPFKGKSTAPSVIQPKNVTIFQGAVRGGIVMPNPSVKKQIPLSPPINGTATPEQDKSNGSNLKQKKFNYIQSNTLSANFQGISESDNTNWQYIYPPDPVIAAGNNYVVEVVNLLLAVYDKSGNNKLKEDLETFFNNFTDNLTDPKIIYDQYSQRWVLLLLAYNEANMTSDYLVAVSQTSDPTGQWYKYSLNAMLNGNTNSNLYADYPGLAYDNNAVYITSNQWTSMKSGYFEYAKIRILNKSQLYSGQTANYTDFYNMQNSNSSTVFTIKPAHNFGTISSEYLINTASGGGNYLSLWRIDNPITNPVLTLQSTLSVGSYNDPPDACKKVPLI